MCLNIAGVLYVGTLEAEDEQAVVDEAGGDSWTQKCMTEAVTEAQRAVDEWAEDVLQRAVQEQAEDAASSRVKVRFELLTMS